MATSAAGGAGASADGGSTGASTGGAGGRATSTGGTTSSGGKGGKAGSGAASGGSSGRPSTGGAPNDAGGPDGSSAPDSGCVDYSNLYVFTWGSNGGLVAYVDTSKLDTPNVYTHSRDQLRNGAPLMCQTRVAGCPSPLLAEINAGLESSVVMDAIRAHTVYGVDSRPVDGTVFRITIGSDYVDVGGPCAGAGTGCIAIPAVVQTLVNNLKALDAQELAKKACTDVFGAP
jgi:hypothetical protein